MRTWNRLLKLLGLVGWGFAGWQLAVWGHQLALDQTAIPAVAALPEQTAPAARLPGLALALGARTADSGGLRPEEVQVVGLMGSAQRGVLLASIRSGPVRPYAAGELSPDGWIFEGLVEGRLRLRRGGQVLDLPAPVAGKGLQQAIR